MKLSNPDRFWKKVQLAAPDECWLWTGCTDREGYGRFKQNGRPVGAHRIALQLSGRRLKEGQCALHSCDNPACVNPRHLRPGTHKQNSADRVCRNRQAKGENNGRAKLTARNVLEVREMAAEGRGQAAIAALTGINRGVVRDIVTGKTWKHVARLENNELPPSIRHLQTP